MSSVTGHFERCSVCECALTPCGTPAAALDFDDSLPADLPRCPFVRAARSPVVLQRSQRGDLYLNLYTRT
ncbi:MAG: hypothetical protein JO352_18285 [Chloroflexi bacterium]|nr:hypothetical protein [Chloroflexota bacterium]MBV9599808.1 hypothetical protein [Chloroflexota bacterium]